MRVVKGRADGIEDDFVFFNMNAMLTVAFVVAI